MADTHVQEKDINPDYDKFRVLLDWMQEHGASFPLLHLRYYNHDYRGVHMLQEAEPNQVILDVPKQLLLTREIAKQSEIGKKITASGMKVSNEDTYIASFLLQERDAPSSFWKPFINSLPVDYKFMPIFFSSEELKLLKGSDALEMINDRIMFLEREHNNLKRLIDFPWSYHDFVWARLAVITRQFCITLDGKKTDSLVPLADMLNHKVPKETVWAFDEKKESFLITSTKTLSQGAEVFDSYGEKCNSRFFVNYGFSLVNNKDNQAVIHLAVLPDSPLYAILAQMIGRYARRFKIPIQHTFQTAASALNFARKVSVQDIGHLSKLSEIGNVVSPRNEVLAIKLIAEACRTKLRMFETTVEEDNSLLGLDMEANYVQSNESKKVLTFNERNSILMRRGEKLVLLHWIKLASLLVDQKFADMGPDEFIKIVEETYHTDSAQDLYIKEVWGQLILQKSLKQVRALFTSKLESKSDSKSESKSESKSDQRKQNQSSDSSDSSDFPDASPPRLNSLITCFAGDGKVIKVPSNDNDPKLSIYTVKLDWTLADDQPVYAYLNAESIEPREHDELFEGLDLDEDDRTFINYMESGKSMEKDDGVDAVPIFCECCYAQGVALTTATEIDGFKVVHETRFTCRSCKWKVHKCEFKEREEKGVMYHLKVTESEKVSQQGAEDNEAGNGWRFGRSKSALSRHVIFSDACSVDIVDVGIEIPAFTHAGKSSTVAQFLEEMVLNMRENQMGGPMGAMSRIANLLEAVLKGAMETSITFRDPSGNTFIAPMDGVRDSEHFTREDFARTAAENQKLDQVYEQKQGTK